jgi:hypothetical protein
MLALKVLRSKEVIQVPDVIPFDLSDLVERTLVQIGIRGLKELLGDLSADRSMALRGGSKKVSWIDSGRRLLPLEGVFEELDKPRPERLNNREACGIVRVPSMHLTHGGDDWLSRPGTEPMEDSGEYVLELFRADPYDNVVASRPQVRINFVQDPVETPLTKSQAGLETDRLRK